MLDIIDMKTSEVLTLAALVLNAIALFFIAYQIILSRRSLETAKKSIDEDKRVRQIEMLPRAHFIIHVQMYMEKWSKESNEIAKLLKKAASKKDDKALKELSKRGLASSKGLVKKSIYEKAPPWLSELYMASAQHYYNGMAPLIDVWHKEEAKYGLAKELADRFEEVAYHIEQLYEYIKEIVPDSYLNAPASMKDERFFDS